MKLDWKAGLGLVVTVLLLWWVLAGVDFGELWLNVREGDLVLLGAAVLVATFGFLIRAARWRVLLAPLRPGTSFGNRFAAVSVGFMANNVLPARVGEFARAYALSRVEPVTASGAFGTLVVERVLDGLTLLAFLLVAVSWPSFPAADVLRDGPLGGALPAVAGIIGALLVGMIALLVRPRPFVRIAEGVASFLPSDFARPLLSAFEAFLDSLAILRSPWLLVQAVAWTVGFWLWHALSFYLAMLAFGIRPEDAFVAALFTEAVVGFGVALPSAPGFVGTFHASAGWALGIYGVDPARSLAFAFGYHFGGWLPITAIGLWYAWKLGLTLGDVEESEVRVEEEVEAEHPRAAELMARRHGEDGADGAEAADRAGEDGGGDGDGGDAGDGGDRRGTGGGSSGGSLEWDREAREREPAPPATGREAAASGVSTTGAPPRPVAAAVEIDAPAKVNLLLRVLDREPSGFHRIETLFQGIDLCDRLRVGVEEAEGADGDEGRDGGIRLKVRGMELGSARENLAWRAARSFREATGAADALHVELDKRIPAGAGLGGGSSDAAATLRALNALYGEPLAPERLSALGAELGSDVPFFLGESPLALGHGRGELLHPLDPLPAAWLVVATPDGVHVDTGEAYGVLDAARAELPGDTRTEELAPDRAWNWPDVAGMAENDFEGVVIPRHVEVAAGHGFLLTTAAVAVLLAGSGGSVFALFEEEAAARRALRDAADALPEHTVRLARTLSGWPTPRVDPSG